MNKRKTVGKQLLSFTLQQEHGLTAAVSDSIIETLFKTIEVELTKGNAVSFLNIGSIMAIDKPVGQSRKAFGKEVVVAKSVKIKINTSPSFIEQYERKKGKSFEESRELASFAKRLKD